MFRRIRAWSQKCLISSRVLVVLMTVFCVLYCVFVIWWPLSECEREEVPRAAMPVARLLRAASSAPFPVRRVAIEGVGDEGDIGDLRQHVLLISTTRWRRKEWGRGHYCAGRFLGGLSCRAQIKGIRQLTRGRAGGEKSQLSYRLSLLVMITDL